MMAVLKVVMKLLRVWLCGCHGHAADSCVLVLLQEVLSFLQFVCWDQTSCSITVLNNLLEHLMVSHYARVQPAIQVHIPTPPPPPIFAIP